MVTATVTIMPASGVWMRDLVIRQGRILPLLEELRNLDRDQQEVERRD